MVQHGANAVFIFVEIFLNSIPFVPYLMGYLGLYVASFGLWAITYFRLHGLWLYPVRPPSDSSWVTVYIACTCRLQNTKMEEPGCIRVVKAKDTWKIGVCPVPMQIWKLHDSFHSAEQTPYWLTL